MRFFNAVDTGEKVCDLVVTTSTPGYKPLFPGMNKFVGAGMAKINVAVGFKGEFNFKFEAGDGSDCVVDQFALSFLDFDQGQFRKGQEIVSVCGAKHAFTCTTTELETSEDNECATFRSTTPGFGSDNPTDLDDLTDIQANRAVTLSFVQTSSFKISFEIGNGVPGYRNFFFAGRPTTSCQAMPPPTPAPTTLSPTPAPPTPAPPMCAGMDWNDAGFDKCGMWGDPHFYGYAGLFDFQGKGIYTMAKNHDASVQVQSFQCAQWENAVSTALAIHIDGYYIFVTKDKVEVTLNGDIINRPDDLDISGQLSDEVTINSKSQCTRIKVKQTLYQGPPYFGLSFKLRLAGEENEDKEEDVEGGESLCGEFPFTKMDEVNVPSEKVFSVANDDDIIFTSSQITEICDSCTRDNPSPFVPKECMEEYNEAGHNPARLACNKKDVPYAKAEEACNSLNGLFYTTCLLDYCASGGDEVSVELALEEKKTADEVPATTCKCDCSANKKPWQLKCTWFWSCGGCEDCKAAGASYENDLDIMNYIDEVDDDCSTDDASSKAGKGGKGGKGV